MSEFPTPNTTPIPSPARMANSQLNSELDPFNVSGTERGMVSLDDEGKEEVTWRHVRYGHAY